MTVYDYREITLKEDLCLDISRDTDIENPRENDCNAATFFMDIADFRDYARSMMFPDPVGIDMSDEFNDMVTEAVNSGKTTLEDAFKKLVKRDSKGRIDYSYSDGFDGFRYGQELLCFCDIETAAQRLGI